MLKLESVSLRGSLKSLDGLKSRIRTISDSRINDFKSDEVRLKDNDSYLYYSSGQLNNDYPAILHRPASEVDEYDDQDDDGSSFHGSFIGSFRGSVLTISADGSTQYIEKIKAFQNKFNPPDGGFGWVVVFASFLIQGITGSIGYIHGMLYPEFLATFQAGGIATAWIASIQIAMWFTGAMIAGPMVQTIGSKKVCMIGSLLMTSSILITAAAKHISMLYIFYGFTTGIGMSFIFFPAVIIVQEYFVKRRSIAVAIANAGVSFGGFAMPPLCDFLLQTLGWRGNMLIMAGISSTALVIAFAFRPLQYKNKEAIKTDEQSQEKVKSEEKAPVVKHIVEVKPIVNQSPKLPHQKDNQPLTKLLGKKMIEEKLKKESPFEKVLLGKDSFKESKQGNAFLKITDEEGCTVIQHKPSKFEENQPLSKLLGKKMILEKLNKESPFEKVILGKDNDSMKEPKQGQPFLKLTDEEGCPVIQHKPSQFKAFIQRLTDFSLLKNPNMTFDMCAYGFYSFGFIVPSMFLPLKAYELGIPQPKPTILISIIGITDVIGRFVTGFMGQVLGKNRLVHYMLSMLIGGSMTAASSFIHSFLGLAVYAGIFGLCTGMARAYSSIVLTDMLGLENLPKAYGFKLFMNGIAVLGSAPFAAFIMEATGSIDVSFALIGIIQALGGVTIFILLILRACGCAPVRKSWV